MNTCQNPLCNKQFIIKSGSLGKYCSLSCGTTHRNTKKQEQRYSTYDICPTTCKYCNTPLLYKQRKNKFCNTSCAAKYNNAQKDYTLFKSGPSKGFIPKNYSPYTKIKQCSICGKYHKKQGKTCSPVCFAQQVSISVRGKTGGNRDLNKPGVDCGGKSFYYDSNWEILLSESLSQNKIYWERPDKFILSDGRSYTPDFYLPAYDIYIDPKAKRPNYYRNSILKIEMFEKEYNKKCLVISNKSLLTWQHIQTMLLVGTYRS